VLRGKSSGYQIHDTINIRRGLARIAHDQTEHLTILAILVQNGLERRRITPVFQAGWSDCMQFFFSLRYSFLLLIWNVLRSFCFYEDRVPF
jgi:hypothetical protein